MARITRYLTLLTSLFVLVALSNYTRANAADYGWLTITPKVEKTQSLAPGDTIPYSINGNRDCYNQPVATRPARVLNVWPFSQAELKTMGCVVDTGFGAVSTNGLLLRQGTDIYGTIGYKSIYGSPVPIVPIPNSSSMLYSSGNSRYGSYYKLLENASNSITSTELITGEVNHALMADGTPLTDKSGAFVPLRYDTISFSHNGEWLVADDPGVSFVRINTITREIIPFGSSFNYSSGYTSVAQTAISEDGRTAVISSGDNGRFMLYDIDSCTPAPDIITKPVACQSRDLLPQMQQMIPGFTGVSTLRFIGSDALTFYAGSRNNDVTTISRYVMYTGDKPNLHTLQYLALGDSFSSGEGAYNYKALTDTTDNHCHISMSSYPYIAANSLGLTDHQSIACSGSVVSDIASIGNNFDPKKSQSKGMSDKNYTTSIIDNYLPGYREQIDFVYKKRPLIVTLTVGGNDIGFTDIIKRCVSVDTCYEHYEDRYELLNSINLQFNRLTQLYSDITAAAGPGSKVYVVGYPKIAAENGNCAVNVHLNNDEIVFANQLTSFLNDMIRRAATNAGVQYINVEDALKGHRLCEASAGDIAVNGLTADRNNAGATSGIANESFHPNALGHSILASKILLETGNFTKAMPAPDTTSQPQTLTPDIPLLNAPHSSRTPSPVTFVEYDGVPLYKNTKVDISIGSPSPLSPVPSQVWIHSTPAQIGSITPASDGTISGSITLPSDIEPGFHTIDVLAKNVLGMPITIESVVYVGDSATDWNGDGILNDTDPCPTIQASGIDSDYDGIDDACDGDLTATDITAPKVTGLLPEKPSNDGWYNHPVNIQWTTTDPAPSSGTPNQPKDSPVDIEGVHEYQSDPSCDPANNCATGSLTVKLDTGAPTIDYGLSPQTNDNGWNSNPVTVTFTCADKTSGVRTCPSPTTVSDDGETTLSVSAEDMAGNRTEVNLFILIDRTAPTIELQPDRSANTRGWFSGPVTFSASCGDALSGVAECSSPTVLANDGQNQAVGAYSRDLAGNETTLHTTANIDSRSPKLSYKISPAPNAGGWNNSSVTISFECTDELSGIADCTQPITINDDGVFIVSGTALDYAGNSSSMNVVVSIDSQAPESTHTSWTNNPQQLSQVASLVIKASDEGSGIRRAEYFVGAADPGVGKAASVNPVDGLFAITPSGTTQSGIYRITYRIEDNAGNWSSDSNEWLIVYDTSGPRIIGDQWYTPSMGSGDILPWLTKTRQDDRAFLVMNIRYNKQGVMSRSSDFKFSYRTGSRCHDKHKPDDRHTFWLDANKIDWLVVSGDTALFQGEAVAQIDTTKSSFIFRVAAFDGDHTDKVKKDGFRLEVFKKGANPNTDKPLYGTEATLRADSLRIIP